ncbi:hypothetical protein QTO34_019417 [Cnephaeus nilssonii]|uniref:Uncharacterized protein n=1 Tax=Cnephaeus nilssonii TaxID=3371016 RepID=A0AA40LP90_CNENI|nr:hypothetical protein QTO34_019417 [Eptesicus nilssonii]
MRPWVRVKLNPGSGRGRVPLDPGEAGSRVRLSCSYVRTCGTDASKYVSDGSSSCALTVSLPKALATSPGELQPPSCKGKQAHLTSRLKGTAFGPQQDILEVQFDVVVYVRHGGGSGVATNLRVGR